MSCMTLLLFFNLSLPLFMISCSLFFDVEHRVQFVSQSCSSAFYCTALAIKYPGRMTSFTMPTKMVNNMGKDKRTVRTIYETPLFLILRQYGLSLKAINPFYCATLSSFSVDINDPVVFLIVCRKFQGIARNTEKKWNSETEIAFWVPRLLNNCILIRPYECLSETIVSSFPAKNTSFLGYSSEDRAYTQMEKQGNGLLSWYSLHFWSPQKALDLSPAKREEYIINSSVRFMSIKMENSALCNSWNLHSIVWVKLKFSLCRLLWPSI